MLAQRVHVADLQAGLLDQLDGLAHRAHVHVGGDERLDEGAATGSGSGHVVENDGKTWKLTLRDGLLFHNGEKVLAQRLRRLDQALGRARCIRPGADGAHRRALGAGRQDHPVPPEAAVRAAAGRAGPRRLQHVRDHAGAHRQTDPFKAFTEVVGCGPFRFKADERVQGSLFVYEKFDKYKPREDGEASFTSGPKIVHFDRVAVARAARTTPPRRRRCRPARWTGGRTRRPICCRC